MTLATTTGVISGTPTRTGTSNFTARVTDAKGHRAAPKRLSLTIGAAPVPPTITTTSLPNGTQNAVYNRTLAAAGGQVPYSWSLSAGSLPAG